MFQRNVAIIKVEQHERWSLENKKYMQNRSSTSFLYHVFAGLAGQNYLFRCVLPFDNVWARVTIAKNCEDIPTITTTTVITNNENALRTAKSIQVHTSCTEHIMTCTCMCRGWYVYQLRTNALAWNPNKKKWQNGHRTKVFLKKKQSRHILVYKPYNTKLPYSSFRHETVYQAVFSCCGATMSS